MNTSFMKWTDEAYGEHERQKFDLAVPKDRGCHGLILFIHGGAWIAGDKEGYRDDLDRWAVKGYAAAAMNYRYIAPDAQMDAEMEDIKNALAAIREKAKEAGADLTRVLLTGTSAGGHLSLLYAYSMAETSPIRPACVVDYCGPTLLSEHGLLYETPGKYPPAEQWTALFSNLTGKPVVPGNEAEFMPLLEKYSPVTHVTGNSVPTIICHGQKDDLVPFSQAKILRDRLEECGVEYVFLPMPEAGHGLEQAEIYRESAALFEIYAERFLKEAEA